MAFRKNILILGAGISGLAMACVLAEADFVVRVLDKNISPLCPSIASSGLSLPQGERRNTNLLRVSALTPSSLNFLAEILKPDFAFNLFSGMKVWGQENPDYASPDLDLKARGAILENQRLEKLLKNKAEKLGVVFYAGEPINLKRDSQKVYLDCQKGVTLEADLLIGADGVNSWVRKTAGISTQIKSYQELALIAVLETEIDHKNRAYQRFINTGPIAFLPLVNPHEISLVWSCEKNKAQELLNLSPEDFEKELEKNFGVLGGLKLKSERLSFELKHHHAKRYISEKIVLIGDAAHSIHPLAGLGLNMGLKDVKVLAEVLIKNKNQNKSYSWEVLASYERERISQNFKIYTAMTGLDFIFKFNIPGLEWGMSFINQSQFLKRAIIQNGL